MKRWQDFLFIGIIPLIVFLYFIPLFFPHQQIIVTPDFGTSDALSSLSYKYIYWQGLQKNTLPFWTPSYGNGFPLLAHGTVGALFLPNLILYKFLPFVSAYNLALITYVSILGIGTYLLLKKLISHQASSFFGSLFFIFSGIVITQITHISVIATASLLPWVILLSLLVVSHFSFLTLLFFIFVSSQQMFAGFPQITYMTHILAIAYTLFPHSSVTIWKKLIRLFLAQILSLITAGPQLLPSVEYFKSLTSSSGFSLESSTLFSFPLKHILTFIFPFFYGDPRLGTYPHFQKFDGSIFWENTGFIGILPFIILFFFIIKRVKEKRPLFSDKIFVFFSCICFFSFLFMLGKNSPLYILYSFFPLNLFRVPSRFIWIFVFSFVVLTTHASASLFSVKNKFINLCLTIVLIINSLHLISTFRSYHALEEPDNWINDTTENYWTNKTYTIGTERTQNSFFLSSGWSNMSPFRTLKDTHTPDVSALQGFQQFLDTSGRDMMRTALIKSFIQQDIKESSTSAAVGTDAETLLSLYGVRSIHSTIPLSTQKYQKITEHREADISKYIYKNENVLPILYSPLKLVYAKTFMDFISYLHDNSYNKDELAIIENKNTVLNTIDKSDDITIISQAESEIRATVRNNQASMVVLNQLFYPGWIATIDGAKTQILPVNILSQGIIVPQGFHEISFIFKPTYFQLTLLLSGGLYGIIVIGVLCQIFSSHVHISPRILLPSSDLRRNRRRSQIHKD